MSADGHNLFERLVDQTFALEGIRPGGLGLTRRGCDLARLAPGDAALDLGCGTGVTVSHLVRENGVDAVGIDSSSLMVARSKANEDALPILLGDAGMLPFANESFDGVFLECTLSLVSDRDRVLRECHRVLSPQGRIIVTDLYVCNPDGAEGLRNLPVRSCLQGALDKHEFLCECLAAGFRNVYFEDHSDVLRDFAVRMIWTFGSLDHFWARTERSSVDRCGVQNVICEARPGYFLSVGFK